jgi:MtfA peptidase
MEIIIGLSLLIGVWGIQSVVSSARKKRALGLLSQPLTETQNQCLEKNFPIFQKLTIERQKKLAGLIHLFIDEKEFTGCEGLEITEEIKVTIAAQACLLLLNNKTQPWYRKLTTVLVYPSAYRVQSSGINDDGFPEEGASVRLGESWGGGTIVLSWNHSRHGGVNFQDGQNVVIHEFAHQLDQGAGLADGVPLLSSTTSYASWAVVLGMEYQKLVRKALKGQKTVMDKYGATNEAEFFAVSSESFFEKPRQMNKKHPELYASLKKYYGLNPLDWV